MHFVLDSIKWIAFCIQSGPVPLHGENLIIQLRLNNVHFIRYSVWFDASVLSRVFFWLTLRVICRRGGTVASTPSGLANKASKEAEAGLGRPRGQGGCGDRAGAVQVGGALAGEQTLLCFAGVPHGPRLPR